MSYGLAISDYGRALQAIEDEVERIDFELATLLKRKSALLLSRGQILSEVREVANVYEQGNIGGGYVIRRVGRADLRAA